jgi:hypothetical protein
LACLNFSDDFGQSLRAREAEWELGTFATDLDHGLCPGRGRMTYAITWAECP